MSTPPASRAQGSSDTQSLSRPLAEQKRGVNRGLFLGKDRLKRRTRKRRIASLAPIPTFPRKRRKGQKKQSLTQLISAY
jgi:hypothetical protein